MSLRELAENDESKEKKKHTLSPKQSRMIRMKGYRAERELVRKLRKAGFNSVRIPVSGPSSQPLPDLFATKKTRILAFEVKAPNADRVYFRKNQVSKLFEFLDMFEMYKNRIPVLAAKFPYKWVYRKVETVDNFVVLKDDGSNIIIK